MSLVSDARPLCKRCGVGSEEMKCRFGRFCKRAWFSLGSWGVSDARESSCSKPQHDLVPPAVVDSNFLLGHVCSA
jgi:hypothetical protein